MSTHTHAFSHWPFADSVDTVAFCTGEVARGRLPVLHVTHDIKGDWQFLDAGSEQPGECKLQCLGCMVERDPSLAQLGDLPPGWSAYRARLDAPWERWRKDSDDHAAERKALHDIFPAHGRRDLLDQGLDRRGGVVAFAIEGMHPHDIAELCDREAVCVRAGHHCAKPLMRVLGVGATARASTYLYNSADDIDALVRALHAARAAFR